MCGISAIVQLPNAEVDHASHTRSELEQQMSNSLDIINHRGPDSRGIWISSDNNVGQEHLPTRKIHRVTDKFQYWATTASQLTTSVQLALSPSTVLTAHYMLS